MSEIITQSLLKAEYLAFNKEANFLEDSLDKIALLSSDRKIPFGHCVRELANAREIIQEMINIGINIKRMELEQNESANRNE